MVVWMDQHAEELNKPAKQHFTTRRVRVEGRRHMVRGSRRHAVFLEIQRLSQVSSQNHRRVQQVRVVGSSTRQNG